MTYAFITFRSHPNEKYLDDEFFVILNPLLTKTDKFLLSQEEAGTLASHYHLIIQFPDAVGDRDKICQKFKSKIWTTWIKGIQSQNLHTKFDPKFLTGALNIQYVKNDESELLKTLGYVGKQQIKQQKGFTDDFVSTAIRFYYVNHRAEAALEPEKEGFLVLTLKTAHVTLMRFCKKENILLNANSLLTRLAENSISTVEFTHSRIDRILAECNLSQHHNNIYRLDKYEYQYYSKIVEGEQHSLRQEHYAMKRDLKKCIDTFYELDRPELAQHLELHYNTSSGFPSSCYEHPMEESVKKPESDDDEPEIEEDWGPLSENVALMMANDPNFDPPSPQKDWF